MAALMYVSEDKSGAALFALGLNKDIVAEKTLCLRGLDSDAKYAVTEINKGATLHAELSDTPRTGRELMEKGIPVKLSGKFDSAVFEVRRIADATPSVRAVQATRTVWLDKMDLSGMSCGWGKPQKNRSIIGKALRPGGTAFKRGVGSHAVSRYEIDCGGKALAFDAMVGVDADGKRVAESPVMHAGTPPYCLHADLAGAKIVELSACDACDGISYDHADWCDARFTVIDGASILPLK